MRTWTEYTWICLRLCCWRKIRRRRQISVAEEVQAFSATAAWSGFGDMVEFAEGGRRNGRLRRITTS
jgi:hypothetical protein